MPIDEARLQKLIDRQDILDCLTRYTRGVDRLDTELLYSAYHPDARDDHGRFVGNREEFVQSIFTRHRAHQRRTFHILGNHTCEIDGNTAHAETYCTYFGYNNDDTVDIVSCRYVDRLEKRKGEWRIADRICVVEGTAALKGGDERTAIMRKNMEELTTNAHTARDREDISYQRPLQVVRKSRMPPS